MEDAVFELGIDSWTMYLYIENVIELYISVWALLGIAVLAGVVKYLQVRNSRKIKPLIGVVPPRRKLDA